MTAMMTLQQAQSWLPGSRLVGDGAVVLQRVHTDTRSLLAGDLFVALKGERFDGGQFLEVATRQGAAAALCDFHSEPALERAGLSGLVVSDACHALGTLASRWRGQFTLPIIAVTGSNGKTTVTQMIASILRAWKGDAALATLGNFNNAIGVPLTLLRLRAVHRAAVIELGMNHPGEIARLADLTRPTVALINNAQREHQEFMTSVEAVAKENGAVIEALGPSGIVVFPEADAHAPLWDMMRAGRPRHTFSDVSDNSGARVHGQAEWTGDAWAVRAHTPAGPFSFQLAVAGRHNVRNALAAVTCALAVGAPLGAVRDGLEAFQPVTGRSKAFDVRLAGRSITVVDDTYNANPDSVRAAIDVLAELPGPRLLVLGDMGEVGEQGASFHVEVGGYARERGVEQVLTFGVLSTHVATGFPGSRHFDDMAALLEVVFQVLPQSASVLVKGSRFMKMERVVTAISREAQSQPGGTSHVA